MECHKKEAIVCKEEATVKAQFGNNCILCHILLKPSSSMFVQDKEGDDTKTAVEVTTHLIAVHPEKR